MLEWKTRKWSNIVYSFLRPKEDQYNHQLMWILFDSELDFLEFYFYMLESAATIYCFDEVYNEAEFEVKG